MQIETGIAIPKRRNKHKNSIVSTETPCSKCGTLERYGRTGNCVFCKREYDRQYFIKNAQRMAVQKKKNYHWLTYDLTPEQVAMMYQAQNGCCAICLEPLIKPLVDHCHETKRNRGLVCNRCNLILGHAKDSSALLWQAIAYLEQHRNATVN